MSEHASSHASEHDDLHERIAEAIRAVGLARNLSAYSVAVWRVVQPELDRLARNAKLAEVQHQATLQRFLNQAETILGQAEEIRTERQRAEKAEAERDRARADLDRLRQDWKNLWAEHNELVNRLGVSEAERDRLTYERQLLAAARMTLDMVAAGEASRWDEVRQAAEDVAQRIVDEIGHSVTDEPALGPSFREQIARLETERDSLERRAGAAEDAMQQWEERAGQVTAERHQLREQVSALAQIMESYPDVHMRFGLIHPDGRVEQPEDRPCADWCYACKLQKANERAELAEAEMARLKRVGEVPLLQGELAEEQRRATQSGAERDQLRVAIRQIVTDARARDDHLLNRRDATDRYRAMSSSEVWEDRAYEVRRLADLLEAALDQHADTRKCPRCGAPTPGLVRELDLCPPCDLALANEVAAENRRRADEAEAARRAEATAANRWRSEAGQAETERDRLKAAIEGMAPFFEGQITALEEIGHVPLAESFRVNLRYLQAALDQGAKETE